MRCKNCGTYNDDNRYICETCGSPLYDEEDIQTPRTDESHTQTFNVIKDSEQQDDNNISNASHSSDPELPNHNGDEKTPAEKKSIIVIAILAVVLVAIIVSVAVVAHSKSKENDKTTTQITTTQSTTESTTRWTTQNTTERTTTTTTSPATSATTTTAAVTWYINTSSSGGGSVTGTGEYKNGEKVTITATADSGYVFDGWYSDGIKVSDSENYTFTANENASFSAVFNPVPTEDNSIETGDVGLEE